MHREDIAELNRFLNELQNESDRGAAVVGASLIDTRLGETLAAFFRDESTAQKLLFDGNAAVGSFSARIDLCSALGLIDEFELHECHLIRKVRNEFAHRLHGVSFADQKIAGYCTSLHSHFPEGHAKSPRSVYLNAVVTVSTGLFYRPEYVARERRQTKQWIDPNLRRWRDIQSEPPPDGAPALFFGNRTRLLENP